MRDRSRLQVVPAALLGQPLLERFGTETAVIAQPDASRKAAFCGGNTATASAMIAQAAVLGQGHDVGGDDGNVVYFVGDVERAGPPARASETMSRMGWPFATALSCASPVMVRGVRGIVRGVSPVYSKSVLVYGMASGLGQAVWGGKAPTGPWREALWCRSRFMPRWSVTATMLVKTPVVKTGTAGESQLRIWSKLRRGLRWRCSGG